MYAMTSLDGKVVLAGDTQILVKPSSAVRYVCARISKYARTGLEQRMGTREKLERDWCLVISSLQVSSL